MICPKLKNINRLFVRSFKNGDSDPTKDYFDKQFMLLIEIRDFSALINNQPFFDQFITRKQVAYEKLKIY